MAQVRPGSLPGHAARPSATGVEDDVRTLMGIARPTTIGKRTVVYARLVEESGIDERGNQHLLLKDKSSAGYMVVIGRAQVQRNSSSSTPWRPGSVLRLVGLMLGVGTGHDAHIPFMRGKISGVAYGRLSADGTV